MNEAYSDFFGNALDVNLSGQPMDAPGVGFIGEDLCKVPDPDNFNCPVRNLNTKRTVEDYIYFLTDFDNGGVHINSPIYGAALWDVREQLGGSAADALIYKALTEFTTPLATFTDGRNSLLAAADALGYGDAQKQAIVAAFDKRGIVAGWDSAAGSDALTLIPNHTPLGFEVSPPRVSGSVSSLGTTRIRAACAVLRRRSTSARSTDRARFKRSARTMSREPLTTSSPTSRALGPYGHI
jgi:hypothetical protein